MSAQEKPPYSVPSMDTIAAIPWNGFNVVSTFSGAGGSCLGYRMAGYRVLWASEFIPAAQEVYKLNHPDSILDCRDIREVTPEGILSSVSLRRGDIDLLDGSPPCASFSTAGKRAKGWGDVKVYSDTKQRVDDLFFEYIRILDGLQPKVFVAENVSGLIKGVAKGYFKEILQAMKDCGYQVTARVLDAQWLGVPQMRQRLIFVGVRNDIEISPAHPSPLPYRYTVREAIPWIESIESANGFNNHAFMTSDKPAGAIQQSRPQLVEAATGISQFAIGDEWDKIRPGEASKKYFSLVKPRLDGPCNSVTITLGQGTGAQGEKGAATVVHPTEKRRFSIAELKRIMAFPDDFQLTGTYAQQWERLGRSVPPVMMRAIAETIREEILCKIT